MENTGDNPTQPQGRHIVLLQIDTLCYQRNELEHKGGQTQVHCLCIVKYYGWQKSTSRDKARSNSEKIKPLALSIVELEATVSQQCKILLSKNF